MRERLGNRSEILLPPSPRRLTPRRDKNAAALRTNSPDCLSVGLMTRMRLSGSCQAVNTAWAAVRVDLPHWRVQLRMTRLEREARTMDWVGSGRKRKRSRAKATGSSEWQSSRSWGIGVLECVEVTKGTDDTVASLGEIPKCFHDGEA